MALKVTKADVWAVEFPDEPGGLGRILSALAEAGANLECIIARRQADKFRAGIAFLTSLKSKKVLTAAKAWLVQPAEELSTLRVEGLDTPGSCSRMVGAIAAAGISMRGVSSMSAGKNFVAYIGLDSAADTDAVAKLLKKLDAKGTGKRKSARA